MTQIQGVAVNTDEYEYHKQFARLIRTYINVHWTLAPKSRVPLLNATCSWFQYPGVFVASEIVSLWSCVVDDKARDRTMLAVCKHTQLLVERC